MKKSELRAYYLEKRKQIDIAQASDAIVDLLIGELTSSTEKIHTFIPIPGSQEINTWQFIKHCWSHDIVTATSLTKFNPKRLEHTWFDANSRFEEGKFNVPIPTPLKPITDLSFDMVIVPLLCTDTRGNRIGYLSLIHI